MVGVGGRGAGLRGEQFYANLQIGGARKAPDILLGRKCQQFQELKFGLASYSDDSLRECKFLDFSIRECSAAWTDMSFASSIKKLETLLLVFALPVLVEVVPLATVTLAHVVV